MRRCSVAKPTDNSTLKLALRRARVFELQMQTKLNFDLNYKSDNRVFLLLLLNTKILNCRNND